MASIVLPNLDSKIRETSPTKGGKGWFIHLENAPAHNSSVTEEAIAATGMTRLQHPPYSPDLAPSDFALFGYLKNHLRSVECSDLDIFKQEIANFLFGLPSDWFEKVLDEWLLRLRCVSENNGHYYPE